MASTPEPNSPEIFTSPAYQPNQSTPQQNNQGSLVLNDTPSVRVAKSEQLSENGRIRVEKATELLTQKRCLIENTDEFNMVEYAHFMSQSTKHIILSRLEYHWNMQYSTLNIHTRYNIGILGTKFHRLMDKGRWLLLPEEDIINQYVSKRGRSEFPKITSKNNEKSYTYTFVARKEMLTVPIHRQGPPSTATPAQFSHFAYPYNDFVKIKSHIHPRFAIFKAGETLKDNKGVIAFSQNDRTIHYLLSHVLDLYQEWTSAVEDSEEWNAFTDTKPPPGDNESTTSRTEGARSTYSTRSATRKRPGSQGGSPSESKRSKGKGGPNDDEAWLDTETLHELDEELPSNNAWASKAASIMSWVAGIQKDMGAAEETSEHVNEAFPGMVPV